MPIKQTIVMLLLAGPAAAQIAERNDVLIAELMADPSPVVGLPNHEYIELKNGSSKTFNLSGWRIQDGSGVATININFVLKPDGVVILCGSSAAGALRNFGEVIAVPSFPSLDNEGEQLGLYSPEGRLIFGLAYSSSWYRSGFKAAGGWSLEMIDENYPCGGVSNWAASRDNSGGSPGTKNSVAGTNVDAYAPLAVRANAVDSLQIEVVFDEGMDSLSVVDVSMYEVSEGIGPPLNVAGIGVLLNAVRMRLRVPLQSGRIYEVLVRGVKDCEGNILKPFVTLRVGLAERAMAGDLVINEILFNPPADGVDYVEINNRSRKVVDLRDCFIAGRSATGVVVNARVLSIENRTVLPGGFLLLASDTAWVCRRFRCRDPEVMVSVDLPAMGDEHGEILLLNGGGGLIDQLSYDENWHFELLREKVGIALERLDIGAPTQDRHNWQSAATDAGWGTPGYKNSQQSRELSTVEDGIVAEPKIFSPDGDGYDDYALFSYVLEEPGYTCNIILYDVSGMPVRHLVRNALCGVRGFFRWDGLGEGGRVLPIGNYIAVIDLFTLQGKLKKIRKVLCLARKLG
ncbi:MAG: lamin tail domain-containing protein [Gemmatimonadaceae bacterium]|nr:lamin tail domain-containing protein [Chitinophagaceae bacterium]